MPRPEQLPLELSRYRTGGIVPADKREAARRGLEVEASAHDVDTRLVGEIGGLIAGLNKAMDVAALAGIDVVITAHYQDALPPARRRCVLRGAMRRIALNTSF